MLSSSTGAKRWTHVIVACARWEAPYINEWLYYHKSIGFDHVFLYCNDGDPGELYETVLPYTGGADAFVTFVDYPYVGAQAEMYKHYLREFSSYCDWFIFLDIDEFLVLRRDGHVANFLRSHNQDVIYINWLFFGHSGFKTRAEGSVLLNYTQRSSRVNAYTKVMIRGASLDIQDIIKRGETGFWHKWGAVSDTPNRYVNVLGDNMSGYYDNFPHNADNYLSMQDRSENIISTAVIYHYAFRSEEDIARRIRRGMSGDFGGQRAFQEVLEDGGQTQFLAQFSQVEDNTLKLYWQYQLSGAYKSGVGRPHGGANVALHKPADQSSISEWSHGRTTQEDASRLVSGLFSKDYNNHTARERRPWWSVDLLNEYMIREIVIFNRIDQEFFADYTLHFELYLSLDGVDWTTLRDGSEECRFGGTDGRPYVWREPQGRSARYVKIQLPGEAFLHLNAVEIYETIALPRQRAAEEFGALTNLIVQTNDPNA
jgi:hypothetical protein